MATILRETHSLPLLPRICDDLFFGPAVDTDKQASFFYVRDRRLELQHHLLVLPTFTSLPSVSDFHLTSAHI